MTGDTTSERSELYKNVKVLSLDMSMSRNDKDMGKNILNSYDKGFKFLLFYSPSKEIRTILRQSFKSKLHKGHELTFPNRGNNQEKYI